MINPVTRLDVVEPAVIEKGRENINPIPNTTEPNMRIPPRRNFRNFISYLLHNAGSRARFVATNEYTSPHLVYSVNALQIATAIATTVTVTIRVCAFCKTNCVIGLTDLLFDSSALLPAPILYHCSQSQQSRTGISSCLVKC